MNFFGFLSKSQIDYTKAAVVSKSGVLSYREMLLKITAISSSLKEQGVSGGDKIALLGNNSVEYVLTVMALWNLKAVPVNLNNRLLLKELNHQINFAGCKFVIYHKEFEKFSNSIDAPSIYFCNIDANNKTGTSQVSINTSKEETALILFTSGSTGNPKAVMLTFGNLISSAQAGNYLFRQDQNDSWLASLPFYHVGGFSIITRTFLYGLTLIIPDSIGNDDIQKSLSEYNPSYSSFVTTQLKRLLDNNVKPNTGLKHILLGGGFLEPELVEKSLNSGWNISKSYGSTETSSFVTALAKEDFLRKPNSAGKALPGNEILILDDYRKPLPAGSPGEIAVQSNAVAAGYLNNEEETNKKFSGNIYYSGDYGYVDEEDYLYVEARRNDLIISGGENINPFEVEKTLLTHPDITEACVFGIEDKDWGHSVAAALIVNAGAKISIESLKIFLKDKLPSYRHPRQIFIVDKFPKTELGKIQKEKLKEMLKGSNQIL